MKIIVAVLNWGLGHASRSIPIIRALREEGFEPVLASDGEALLLLRKEFPDLQCLDLPSYNITYPEKAGNFLLHFLLRGPQMLRAVISEQRRIKKFVAADQNIRGIISDNRLGACIKGLPSAYLTHQVKVLSGRTTMWTSLLHRFFINKHSECWVPDYPGRENLSGKMSHGLKLQNPVKFLGPLSSFQIRKEKKKYDLLVLLSGPEPQRSFLEEKLLQELMRFQGSILFVRGKVEEEVTFLQRRKMEIYNFLHGTALEAALNSSAVVLARSGYSTIMDLAVLGKCAFFIPTPGQFEQQYLARRLQDQNIAPFCQQDEFRLEKLEELDSCSGFTPFTSGSSLSGAFALFKSE